MDNKILASVIIPAYNRRDSLKRALDALQKQALSFNVFEVVVVVDGCTDETSEMLHNYHAPYPLQIIEQSNQGLSRSRNNGVDRARGKIVIFHDDDLEAAPSFVDAHIKAHRDRSDLIVIGDSVPVIPNEDDFIYIVHRMWWADYFDGMRQPGHRFNFREVAGCNFSVCKELFIQSGGFNSTVSAFSHEDSELGIRLIKNGAQFKFAHAAVGRHYVTIEILRDLHRKMQEGHADVEIARNHPDLLPALPLYQNKPTTLINRFMFRLAFNRPGLGDIFAKVQYRLLLLVGKVRLYEHWLRHLGGLNFYWYWRGVAKELGSEQAVLDLLKTAPKPENTPFFEIDIAEGLATIREQLDKERPSRLKIFYKNQLVGTIDDQPGAERICSRHLYRYLTEPFAKQFIKMLALENVLDQSENRDPILDRFLAIYQITEGDFPSE